MKVVSGSDGFINMRVDTAGSDISAFEVDRKPVLKVGGWLYLSQNWCLYLQL